MSDPTTPRDTIFLRGLAIECIIGFIDWERRVKQTVVIDLELPVDCRRAAVRDEVEDTLDPQGCAEEQRQREAPRLLFASQRLLQGALRDATQGDRGRQEEEGAPEVRAPDEEGREPSASPAPPRS